MLARQGYYTDVIFHRLVPGFMVRVLVFKNQVRRQTLNEPDTNGRPDRNRFGRAVVLGHSVPGRV
jgi:cyclophilin family peptidyl-prolyl cis-trans isomerase